MKMLNMQRSSTWFYVDTLVFFLHFLSRSSLVLRYFLSVEALLLINILAGRGRVVCKINGSFGMSSLGFLCFIYLEIFFYHVKVVSEVTSLYFDMLKLHLGKVKSSRDFSLSS